MIESWSHETGSYEIKEELWSIVIVSKEEEDQDKFYFETRAANSLSKQWESIQWASLLIEWQMHENKKMIRELFSDSKRVI